MIILKHDAVLGLQTYVSDATVKEVVYKDGPILIPKLKSNIFVRYDDWVSNYSHLLQPHIDELWNSLFNLGIVVDYKGFSSDFLKCLYKKSASRYCNFTFLST